jgi:hypothetical protein
MGWALEELLAVMETPNSCPSGIYRKKAAVSEGGT